LLGPGAGEVDDATWKALMGEADKNGDGEITFDEFEVMMKKLWIKS